MHLVRHLLGLSFLLALADAIIHQPPYTARQRQLLPLSSYAPLLHTLLNNQLRYREYVDGHINLNGKYLRPSYLFIDNRNSQEYSQVDARSQVNYGIEYPDAQLRINKQDNPHRFLFGGSTFTNPFWKTATYTSVSSLNVTKIQNCIPSANFVAGGSTVLCRKKREILLSEDTLQFPNVPSKPQQVTVTLLPSVDLSMRDDRQLRTPIVSSIDEVIRNEEWQERQDVNKEKRLFHHYVSTTTVYSYVLSTLMSFRTISPVAGNLQQVLCLLNGYVVCT